MHGRGNFSDPRIGVNIVQEPDLVTPKLRALRDYQHSIPAPKPPDGSYDEAAAERGKVVFGASCVSCRTGGNLTDNYRGELHAPRRPERILLTLCGHPASSTAPRPSGASSITHRISTMAAPRLLPMWVMHYKRVRKLGLTPKQQAGLVEYLKSL